MISLQLLDEVEKHRLCSFRTSGPYETGAISLVAVSSQGELADQQNFTSDIVDVQIEALV